MRSLHVLESSSWGLRSLKGQHRHASTSATKLAGEKMEAIANLIEIARTRLASQMTLTEDVFERDEISLVLDSEAARFVRTRAWLLASGLDSKERAIMDQIAVFIGPALDLQRKVSEMARSDDPQRLVEAQRMVMFEVFPLQGEIIDKFMEMFRLQKEKIEQANRQTERNYDGALQLASLIISGSILLAVMIASYIVRKSTAMERALQNEKNKASTTLNSIGDAVISTDVYGRIEYMNPMAETLTGFTLAEAASRPVGKIFQARDEVHDRTLSMHVLSLAQGGQVLPLSGDIRLQGKQGEKYWIDLTLAPIFSQDGIIRGVILTFRDDT